MSYTESRRYYTQKPLVTYAREPSADSRTTSSTRSSGEGYYTSSRTSTSMANSGYSDSSQSRSTDARIVQYRRVPDNENYYVTSTTSRNGRVETHNHRQPRHDPAEPRAKEATYEEYNRSRVESRRIEERRSQSYRS